jgi:guanine deaminase
MVWPDSDHNLKLIEHPVITVKKTKDYAKIIKISTAGIAKTRFKQSIIFPPFIDMHFHWHQDRVSLKKKSDLLKWLNEQVFPQEAKYSNVRLAQRDALRFSKKLLQVGTLGGCCYSPHFREASEFAFKYFKGNFFIGNTLMDQNVPTYLLKNHQEIISDSKYLSKYSGYALTPRFAISTSPELIKKLRLNYRFIQTHLAENIEEVILTNKLYNSKNYTEVYQKMGILTPRTILAHAIYLSKEEWKVLQKYNVIIAHCPTSNAPINERGLESGLFDYKTADKHKIRWGLASDIGGGPYLSMFDVITSFARQQNTTLIHGLYRATINNYKILNLPLPLQVNSPASFIVLPMVSYRNSEDLLKNLTSPCAKNREKFNHLLRATVYNGEVIWH